MNPQATTATPNQPVTPVTNQVNPQGVATPPVVTAPTPSALPVAPTPVATPSVTSIPQQTNYLPQQLNNIADYYSIPRQTAAITNAAQAQGANAQQATKYSTAQAGYTADMAQKQLTASNYTITKNSDGSVKIINPLGQQVSLATYNNLTGQSNPVAALASATDPASVKAYQAYTNLQNYIQAKTAAAAGDETAQAEVNDFNKQNPGLENIELGQLGNAFMSVYGSLLYGHSPGNHECSYSSWCYSHTYFC